MNNVRWSTKHLQSQKNMFFTHASVDAHQQMSDADIATMFSRVNDDDDDDADDSNRLIVITHNFIILNTEHLLTCL